MLRPTTTRPPRRRSIYNNVRRHKKTTKTNQIGQKNQSQNEIFENSGQNFEQNSSQNFNQNFTQNSISKKNKNFQSIVATDFASTTTPTHSPLSTTLELSSIQTHNMNQYNLNDKTLNQNDENNQNNQNDEKNQKKKENIKNSKNQISHPNTPKKFPKHSIHIRNPFQLAQKRYINTRIRYRRLSTHNNNPNSLTINSSPHLTSNSLSTSLYTHPYTTQRRHIHRWEPEQSSWYENMKFDREPIAPNRGDTVGIKLGSTNLSISFVADGGIVFPVKHRDDSVQTPAVVGLTASGYSLFGKAALEQQFLNPLGTVYDFMKYIGRPSGMAANVKDQQLVPFKLGSFEGETGFSLWEKNYSVDHIITMLMAPMRHIINHNVFHVVDQCVLTVPATFTQEQRAKYEQYFTNAGFLVKDVILEPIAAAMAYGTRRTPGQKIAVWDMGGTTFTFSLLEVLPDRSLHIKATKGTQYLGGIDFDSILTDYLIDQLQIEFGIDFRSDEIAVNRIKNAAKDAKEALSVHTKTRVHLPFIHADQTGPRHFDTVIHRDQYNQMALPYLWRTMQFLNQCFEESEWNVADINEVILAGGMSRWPLIKSLLTEYFKPTSKMITNVWSENEEKNKQNQHDFLQKNSQNLQNNEFFQNGPNDPNNTNTDGNNLNHSVYNALSSKLSPYLNNTNKHPHNTHQQSKNTANSSIQTKYSVQIKDYLPVDEVFAIGAAHHGANLKLRIETLDKMTLNPLGLGFSMNNNGEMNRLIGPNRNLPARESVIITPSIWDQPNISIDIYQGDHILTKYNRYMGSLMMDVPQSVSKLPKSTKYIVTFDLDRNGNLTAKIDDPHTGTRVQDSFGSVHLHGLNQVELNKQRDLAVEMLDMEKEELDAIQAYDKAQITYYHLSNQYKRILGSMDVKQSITVSEKLNNLYNILINPKNTNAKAILQAESDCYDTFRPIQQMWFDNTQSAQELKWPETLRRNPTRDFYYSEAAEYGPHWKPDYSWFSYRYKMPLRAGLTKTQQLFLDKLTKSGQYGPNAYKEEINYRVRNFEDNWTLDSKKWTPFSQALKSHTDKPDYYKTWPEPRVQPDRFHPDFEGKLPAVLQEKIDKYERKFARKMKRREKKLLKRKELIDNGVPKEVLSELSEIEGGEFIPHEDLPLYKDENLMAAAVKQREREEKREKVIKAKKRKERRDKYGVDIRSEDLDDEEYAERQANNGRSPDDVTGQQRFRPNQPGKNARGEDLEDFAERIGKKALDDEEDIKGFEQFLEDIEKNMKLPDDNGDWSESQWDKQIKKSQKRRQKEKEEEENDPKRREEKKKRKEEAVKRKADMKKRRDDEREKRRKQGKMTAEDIMHDGTESDLSDLDDGDKYDKQYKADPLKYWKQVLGDEDDPLGENKSGTKHATHNKKYVNTELANVIRQSAANNDQIDALLNEDSDDPNQKSRKKGLKKVDKKGVEKKSDKKKTTKSSFSPVGTMGEFDDYDDIVPKMKGYDLGQEEKDYRYNYRRQVPQVDSETDTDDIKQELEEKEAKEKGEKRKRRKNEDDDYEGGYEEDDEYDEEEGEEGGEGDEGDEYEYEEDGEEGGGEGDEYEYEEGDDDVNYGLDDYDENDPTHPFNNPEHPFYQFREQFLNRQEEGDENIDENADENDGNDENDDGNDENEQKGRKNDGNDDADNDDGNTGGTGRGSRRRR